MPSEHLPRCYRTGCAGPCWKTTYLSLQGLDPVSPDVKENNSRELKSGSKTASNMVALSGFLLSFLQKKPQTKQLAKSKAEDGSCCASFHKSFFPPVPKMQNIYSGGRQMTSPVTYVCNKYSQNGVVLPALAKANMVSVLLTALNTLLSLCSGRMCLNSQSITIPG